MWIKTYKAVIVLVIVLQAIVHSLDGNQLNNKDSNKLKLDPSHLHYLEVFELDPASATRTVAPQKDHTFVNDTFVDASYTKKWHLGRVIRKHYEIVNMLWRKKKEFLDTDMSTLSTPTYSPVPAFKIPTSLKLPLKSAGTSSTPSYIEFYYLDETDDRIMESNKAKTQKKANTDVDKDNSNFKIFAFHVDDPYFIQSALTAKLIPSLGNLENKTTTPYPSLTDQFNSIRLEKNNPQLSVKTIAQSVNTVNEYILKNYSNTNSHVTKPNEDLHNKKLTSTTINDRIKFFEMYDKHTPLPDYDLGKNYFDDIDKIGSEHRLDNQKNIHLEYDTNSSSGKHESNHIKKHITDENNGDPLNVQNVENITMQAIQTSNMTSNGTKHPFNKPFASPKTVAIPSIYNKLATWSEHSYMAVYIYEPSQVHCDAAGISPHWLVTSGSCLSRHHKNPGGEGRSAYVAYCSTTWWQTERMFNYVKYSVVHPNYHQRDPVRRYMYNIGLVQVVTSMATCPGWTPISLMSHHFTTNSTGFPARSVGWGLDRYDTRYTAAKLPRNPLLIYESRVFSDSCPGNLGYAEVKRTSGPSAVKNVYCLTLPPYTGEASDPIHGSMLIVGGNLCAIFLQEERRASGNQCAEYTGTWRLGPWVTRVARELEYVEPFPFVI